MLDIRLATEVEDQVIFDAWCEGYSDYLHKFKLELSTFITRYVENESVREYSYVAFDDDKPVGLMLGNIKEYDGIKTMRCGGFAVIPSHRRLGVGKALFDQHLALGAQHDCKQLYLEVLKENERALGFYRSVGYRSVYDYRSYVLKSKMTTTRLDVDVQIIDFDLVREIRESLTEFHLFWQGEMFVLEHFKDLISYGIFKDGEVVAVINLKPNGLVNFIWTRNDMRLKGLAKHLLIHAASKLNGVNLSAVASNNYAYEGFLRHLGFESQFEQHEMMLPIKNGV